MPARLVFDCLSLLMVILCLAYYWQGNKVHEWLGVALFLFIMLHNTYNRIWYRHINKHVEKPKSMIVTLLNGCLIITALTLLTTSLLVSREVMPNISESPGYFVRSVHIVAGYWLFVLVAIHAGLNGNKVTNWFSGYRFMRKAPVHIGMKLLLLAVSIQGIISFNEMVLLDKLTMNPVLFMWDFSNLLGFIFHHISIFVFISFTTFYAVHRMRWQHWFKASKKSA
jgi:heme/copper-type cytochrome/quinol oxidase subunit 2